jgi:hypothetical protein
LTAGLGPARARGNRMTVTAALPATPANPTG